MLTILIGNRAAGRGKPDDACRSCVPDRDADVRHRRHRTRGRQGVGRDHHAARHADDLTAHCHHVREPNRPFPHPGVRRQPGGRADDYRGLLRALLDGGHIHLVRGSDPGVPHQEHELVSGPGYRADQRLSVRRKHVVLSAKSGLAADALADQARGQPTQRDPDRADAAGDLWLAGVAVDGGLPDDPANLEMTEVTRQPDQLTLPLAAAAVEPAWTALLCEPGRSAAVSASTGWDRRVGAVGHRRVAAGTRIQRFGFGSDAQRS